MHLEQTANLQSDPVLSELVAQKDALLDEIGPIPVSGTWDLLTDDWGRPLLKLRLKDEFGGEAAAGFAPDELRNEPHFSSRLGRLKAAARQVGQWRSNVHTLFSMIRQWCQNLPGGAYIDEQPVTLIEQNSGDYTISRLVISSGGQTMRVEPIAAWVVGADGRVDLNGLGGPLTLVYDESVCSWFYVPIDYLSKLEPLNETLFLKLAEACLDG